MFEEHRIEPRERLAVPLQIGGRQQGMTRDISATGLYFEIDQAQQLGALLDLQIDLEAADTPLRLVAQGRIVRIEHKGGRTGVAVRLLDARLEAATP